MKTEITQINLLLAWLWILLGFISGLVLGICFHRENWLGGYASFKSSTFSHAGRAGEFACNGELG